MRRPAAASIIGAAARSTSKMSSSASANTNHPSSTPQWQGQRWSLVLLLAAMGMLGPFSVDAYLPALSGIGADLRATPAQMQQTLSAFFLAWALMNLFHGALADSLGRRPVVLGGIVVFTLASIGCALSQSLGQLVFFRVIQGLAIGVGHVISRAVIRDLYEHANAQRLMSQVAIVHSLSPVVAAVIGGYLYSHFGWRSIFWLLTALVAMLGLATWRLLPETLRSAQIQPLRLAALLHGYRVMLLDARVSLLALGNALPFCGGFVYVLSAPQFMGEHLGLAPTQFYWLFVAMVSGLIGGAVVSGRLAGRVTPARQIRIAQAVMFVVALCNLFASSLFKAHVAWSLFPMGLFIFGWALAMPALTLLLLDLHPDRRGLASSLQSCASSACIGLASGLLIPLVLHSTFLLALCMMGFALCGVLAWACIARAWPHLGQSMAH